MDQEYRDATKWLINTLKYYCAFHDLDEGDAFAIVSSTLCELASEVTDDDVDAKRLIKETTDCILSETVFLN